MDKYQPPFTINNDMLMLVGHISEIWLFRCGETASPDDWKPAVRA